MINITVEITDEELMEVTQAYRVLQRFLEKIVSPSELYTDEFLEGLNEAGSQVKNKEFSEVKDFTDLVQ